MLIIFAILYISQRFLNTDAAPLSVLVARQTTIDSPLPQECVCQNLRSIWDIVQSCLATIFICSWVSVHPNIPEKGKPWWQNSLRRMELMFWSIISPELIMLWAAKQWLGAEKLKEMYKDRGWTKTHGYFIQMGGFMLYDGEKAVGVLDPKKLESLLASEEITLPSISEDDIQDRSKGDGLSKALVVIQAAWFIVQCIARRAQGFVITEIELATLAFATLNSVMYFLWWNKPLDVASTVPVYLKPAGVAGSKPAKSGEHQVGSAANASNSRSGNIENGEPQVKRVEDVGDNGSGDQEEVDLELTNLISRPDAQLHAQPRVMHNIRGENLPSRAWWLLSGIIYRWPAAATVAVVQRFGDIVNTNITEDGKMRINTFYAYGFGGSSSEGHGLFAALAFVGAIFGAIHCAGWDFVFPSLIEANVWRVSSAIITGVPVVGYLFVILTILSGDRPNNFLARFFATVFVLPMFLLTCVLLPFYVLARLVLLFEAIISLRHLPLGTLEVVEWTSFIPHI